MLSDLFDKLVGGGGAPTGPAVNLLRSARVQAWAMGHPVADLEHLAARLFSVLDVRDALEREGVIVADLRARFAQMFLARPSSDLSAPPTYSQAMDRVVLVAGRPLRASRVAAALSQALPPELDFFAVPFRRVLPQLLDRLDGTISCSKSGGLTFDHWHPSLLPALAAMQTYADGKTVGHPAWEIHPVHFFVALVASRELKALLEPRGVDRADLLKRFAASLPESPWPRLAPIDHQPEVSPSLYSILVRAERFAAEDASVVRLRHALAALHDDDEIAPFIREIAAAG